MDRLRIILLLMAVTVMLTVCAEDVTPSETARTQIVVDVDSIEAARTPTPSLCRTLSVEIGGASFGPVCLSYDSRFRPGSVFGYRVGIGFTDGSYRNAFGDHILDFKGTSIPLEVNAIMGKRKSKFELGIGIVPSILNRDEHKWEYHWSVAENGHTIIDTFNEIEKHGTRVNIMGFMNVGYRYQRQSGFFMRVGLSFLMGDVKCSPVDGLTCLPYIAFGYTI